MKLIKNIAVVVFMAAVPLFAGAVANANDLFTLVQGILGKLVPLIIAFAVVILLIAIVNYIRAGEDEEKKKTAKSMMIYGIIGLFVMVSVWGLVQILVGTLSLTNTVPDSGSPTNILPKF